MVKIKKLTNTAKIPTRGTPFAAGADLYADIPEEVIIFPGERVKIHTGLAMQIQPGLAGFIFPRSGLACNSGIRLSNCVGVIDSDYRGEVMVSLTCDDKDPQRIQPGERIGQIVFIHYEPEQFEEVDKLDETIRGEGGFGSTGQF